MRAEVWVTRRPGAGLRRLRANTWHLRQRRGQRTWIKRTRYQDKGFLIIFFPDDPGRPSEQIAQLRYRFEDAIRPCLAAIQVVAGDYRQKQLAQSKRPPLRKTMSGLIQFRIEDIAVGKGIGASTLYGSRVKLTILGAQTKGVPVEIPLTPNLRELENVAELEKALTGVTANN